MGKTPKFDPTKPFDLVEADAAEPQGPSALERAGQEAKDTVKAVGQGTSDALKGYTQQFLMGSGDELAGAEQSGLDTVMRGLNQLGLADKSPSQVQEALDKLGIKQVDAKGQTVDPSLYEQGKKEQEQMLDQAAERSPIAYGAGSVGGAIAGGLATSGAGAAALKTVSNPLARGAISLATGAGEVPLSQLYKGKGLVQGAAAVAPELAKRAASAGLQGAAMGALGAEEGKRLEGAKEGAEIGATFGGALLPAATEAAPALAKAGSEKLGKVASEVIEDSPSLKKLKTYFDLGKEGQGIYGEANQAVLAGKEQKGIEGIVDNVLKVDSELGKKVGQSIEEASAKGVKIDADPTNLKSGTDFLSYVDQNKNVVGFDPDANKLFEQMRRYVGGDQLNPKEVYELAQDLNQFGDRVAIKSPDISNFAHQYARDLRNNLKTQVPEFATASERFKQYRDLVTDRFINRDVSSKYSQDIFKDISRPKEKLYKATKDVVEGASLPGQERSNEANLIRELQKNMGDFQASEAARVGEGKIAKDVFSETGVSPESIPAELKKQSEFSSALTSAYGAKPKDLAAMTGPAKAIKAGLLGKGQAAAVNASGKVVGTVMKPAKNLYKIPDDELMQHVQRILGQDPTNATAQQLEKAVATKDVAKRNAALFTLLQNPKTRPFFSDSEEEK